MKSRFQNMRSNWSQLSGAVIAFLYLCCLHQFFAFYMKERQLTVVIADGAPEDRADLQDALSRDPVARYVVIEADSGARAIELCRERSPDCLILNHDLPDLSGLDVLKKLAAEDGSPACAVVVLVGAGDARLAVEAMMSGARVCLEKHRDSGKELRRVVSQSIEMTEQRRRDAARERELIEKNRALEVNLTALRLEGAASAEGAEAWQVARAGAGPTRPVVLRPEKGIHDQAEVQLRLLKTAIEQSNESIIIATAQLDPPGPEVVYANSAFTKMTGYALEEVIGKTPHILQGPKTDSFMLSQLCKECAAGKVFRGETINYRKDRSEVHMEWTAGPVRNEGGEVTHFATALRDVTEPRRVEEELRRSEKVFRSLFDLSAIGMAQVSPEGRYLRVNRKFCQMLGYSEQELLQLTLHDVTHPDDREFSAARLNASFADGSNEFSIEKRYVRKDGEIIWVQINWTVIPEAEERPRRTVANVQDITERKRAEESLREKEAQLRAIIDHSSAVVFVKDLKGRYLRVNRQYEVLRGITEAEVKGKTDYDLYAKEIADAVSANDQEVIAADTPLQFEEHVAFADGMRDFIAVKFPLRDESGRPYAVCGIATDITERKQFEEAMLTSEAQLRAILDHSVALIFVKDLEGRYLRVNRSYEEHFGVIDAELKGKTDYDCHSKEIADAFIANDRKVIAANRPILFEERSLVAGETRYSVVSKFPLLDESGRPYAICGIATDITERKRAETALRESQILNQAVLDSLAANIAVLDRYGNIIAVNEDWRRFALENGGAAIADSVGVNYLDVCRRAQEQGDGQIEATLAGIKAVLDGARANFTVEYPCHSPSEERWFLMSVTPLGGERGGVVVTHTNITSRWQAEEAIVESESRLRQLADAMPQIVYTSSPDGMVDYGNQRWVDYVGVPVEQSVGRKWMDAIHPDDREITRRRFKESGRTGQPFEVEYRLRRKDGQYRWYLARATAIRNERGRIVKWIGTSTDIHDRKGAEAEREELLARERTARAEAEHSAESIRRLQAVTDSALVRLTLDDLLHEMLARIRELLATDSAAVLLLTEDGQSLSVHATIGWDEAATGVHVPVGKGVAGSIAASRAPLVVEDISAVEVVNPVLRRNARSLIGAPLIVEGRLIGVIHTETTRLRRFTEDDVRLLQLAADRVALAIDHARLYEVEQQARRQAEEANRMKDEFLALVSHELRSPLNAILGYAALLRYGGLDAKKVKHSAEVIERSGKAQAQLIDDLLDTARIISGKLRLEVGPVDLVSVIEQAVQTIHPAADAKGISVETNLPSEIGQITGDPARLQQVVWNLLSNAVKFTPQGGRVEALLERIDPHICITVSDTGKGIGPDFLPYVFDRFRQADASSARRYGGLGLGLALVKYLVELHGGTIEAESAGEGHGATFKVTLPVRAVATPLGEAAGASATVKSSGELAGVRALVVDDEDDARELIETVLTQYGADVVAVSSAAEAYAQITTTPPQGRLDVVVTDIGMPGEDGYTMIRRVREWEGERGAHIPAVALTAYGRVEDRVRALNAGFQMHVAKPVEPAELAAVITSLIRRQNSGELT
jgi:PAS domain S-box-containing protein